MARREEVAFLLWCANEGYLLAEDRDGLHNHFLDPPEILHPDDRAARPGWLEAADTVIAATQQTKTERDAVIEAILADADAPEYLITNTHADQWRAHLRKHIPVQED